MAKFFHRFTWLTCAASLSLFAATGDGLAKQVLILGDSIGVGISMASGAGRLARESVAIRSAAALEQIRRAPAGSIAVLSLGTNDAVGNIRGVEQSIDRLVDAAERAGVKLVWVGPPCVLKPWNATAERLDAILRAKLVNRVTYVSVSDQSVCDRGLRAGDGVHFTMKGYAMLWGRAKAAISDPIDLAEPRMVASLETAHPRHVRHKTAHTVRAEKVRSSVAQLPPSL